MTDVGLPLLTVSAALSPEALGCQLLGGYAYQRGEITKSLSATALAGARLAQLPTHTFSLWNKWDVSERRCRPVTMENIPSQ